MDLSSIGENSGRRRHYADPVPACLPSGRPHAYGVPEGIATTLHIQD
jgi:hypothetical protein